MALYKHTGILGSQPYGKHTVQYLLMEQNFAHFCNHLILTNQQKEPS